MVVHLAAMAQPSGMTWEELLSANIIGCYNVFEASRQAGVKRIVFASSGATVRNWDRVFPYDAIVAGRYDEVPETWKKVDHDTPAWPGGTLRLLLRFSAKRWRGISLTLVTYLDNLSAHRCGHS